MNKSKLKSYAPQARKDFIAAVTARANLLGLSDKAGQLEVIPAQTQGDVTLIAGQPWPAKVTAQRNKLISRMQREGFEHTCEAVAYTWFNRFAALRFMELHDYLGHGHRALSSSSATTTGALPDILTHAADLAQGGDFGLPGLNAAKVLEMKLAGNRDGELYRMLLVAQCNALNAAMPFLFERIDDDTELLLPDNLLRTDSVIAKLVQEIPEVDWAEIEIIGWLYQFYISEKKDQVIGKVVQSEDIPAATQLFTPNWIVQYLVQNSVGRLWLMANPASTLASQWPYYIQPAEQTPEVQAQLDALIQTRIDEDGSSLNPETITVLDPACGSGHILVVAYDLLKTIYLERGYQPRSIPRLILEKNLFGLDIDDRAAQMAGFALLMKARADDRRLFGDPPKLNVLSLQESKGLDAAALAQALNSTKTVRTELVELQQLCWLIDTFEHAKTFGSLMQIDRQHPSKLRKLLSIVQQLSQAGDLYAQAAAQDVLPLVQQAMVLGMEFDAVVANPPYMGIKGMNPMLSAWVKDQYPDSKADLFAMFMERNVDLARPGGLVAMITMHSWMFLSTYSALRQKLFDKNELLQMFHTGPGLFPDLGAFNVLTTNFVILKTAISPKIETCFIKANDTPNIDEKIDSMRSIKSHHFISILDLKAVPDFPLVYWFSSSALSNFSRLNLLANVCPAKGGLTSGNNSTFVRCWFEVNYSALGLNMDDAHHAQISAKKWFPYNKGGKYRKWYGNNDVVINWENGGDQVVNSGRAVIRNSDYYFREGIVYSSFGFENFGVRYKSPGFIFDVSGSSIFPREDLEVVLAFLCSSVAFYYLRALAPTVNFQVGDLGRLPLPTIEGDARLDIIRVAKENINLCKIDWDSVESSWDFQGSPLINFKDGNLRNTCKDYLEMSCSQRDLLRENEQLINQIMIASYKVEKEVEPDVNDRDLSIKPKDLSVLVEELISHAIGCMMGRYSLDEPGLIYAHAGNVGFDASRYATFPADADGIVPLTDELWFSDDAASRVREFLLTVWGADTLEENMAWLAESLGNKANETPDETIRRYLTDKFFKHHLQTYKKRPIYWLFSSGKQGAFQALVYLHRYTESTLARLRAEYVVPLTSKMRSRLEMLQKDLASASSTAARNKLAKEMEKLKKKHAELLAYDEQLRHYADMRIALDLDDGVKVNYGKFGDLLESVKAVTAGASDE